MKIDRGLLLTLGTAALTAACASAGTAGPGGGGSRITVPLPSVTCSTGRLANNPMADSAAGRLALVAMTPDSARAGIYTEALEQARRATQAEPDNAYGYYVAGQAAVWAAQYAEAATFLGRSVELCPELGPAEVNQLRAGAAGNAFNQAAGLLQAQDTAGALTALQSSVALDPNSYPAEFYLGLVNFSRDRTAEGIRHWRRTLEILESLPADSVAETNAQRVDMRANALNAMVLAGVQYLQNENNAEAATVLEEMTRRLPTSADAAYHYALALYNLERWQDLVGAGQRSTQLAPLSYGSWVLYYNAYAGQAQAAAIANRTAQSNEFTRQANAVRAQTEALPAQLDRIQIDVNNDATQIRGEAVGTGRTAPVTVEFILHGLDAPLGTGRVTITPPAKDQRAPFELSVANTSAITGYSYRVVQ